jgi:hypothetical protein
MTNQSEWNTITERERPVNGDIDPMERGISQSSSGLYPGTGLNQGVRSRQLLVEQRIAPAQVFRAIGADFGTRGNRWTGYDSLSAGALRFRRYHLLLAVLIV